MSDLEIRSLERRAKEGEDVAVPLLAKRMMAGLVEWRRVEAACQLCCPVASEVWGRPIKRPTIRDTNSVVGAAFQFLPPTRKYRILVDWVTTVLKTYGRERSPRYEDEVEWLSQIATGRIFPPPDAGLRGYYRLVEEAAGECLKHVLSQVSWQRNVRYYDGIWKATTALFPGNSLEQAPGETHREILWRLVVPKIREALLDPSLLPSTPPLPQA